MIEEKVRIKDLETEIHSVSNDDYVVVDGLNGTRKIKASKLIESVFLATYNHTTFSEIRTAFQKGMCVKCKVSGYTYELIQSTETKFTFYLTQNADEIISQNIASVTYEDIWELDVVNIAKSSEIKTKTSELENNGDGTTGSKMVKSTYVTDIVRCTELPSTQAPNTLYIVVE